MVSVHCFHPHSGISIDNRLINYIFSDFVVVRKQREIIPLRVKDCFVKLSKLTNNGLLSLTSVK